MTATASHDFTTPITIIRSIRPAVVCKRYTAGPKGLEKTAVASVTEGEAFTRDVPDAAAMVALLRQVTERSDLVICPGGFRGAVGGSLFRIVSEAKLAELMRLPLADVPGGVLDVDGQPTAARLKRGIDPSPWLLLDADNPPGMPEAWACLTLPERLALMEEVVPGISTCERIELRGSSARVVNGTGTPGPATHAWLRVSDAHRVATLKAAVLIDCVNAQLSFKSPRFSRKTPGEIIGHSQRTLVDLSVWDIGRLVFTAKPDVQAPGYIVADAGITVVNPGAGPLDISGVTLPDEPALAGYRAATGHRIELRAESSGLSIRTWGELTWETEIEQKGVVRSLREWARNMKPGDKMRCETPFRASVSEAGVIRMQNNGSPVLHDVGTGTTHHLAEEKPAPDGAWPEPLDFLADTEVTGVPPLKAHHLPAAVAPFVFDTARRMGVDPATVALCAIVALCSVISDDWRLQPKMHDTTWTEQARLWGAIIGPPSILKSPVLSAATKPIDRLDAIARDMHAEAMRAWNAECAAIKKENKTAAVPPKPKCDRYMVESVTPEALSEVMRDDDEARFRVPCRKLLVRQDEMSEWLANMDRYASGGKGGGDRGVYLRLYNGGRHTVDRIGRGSFAIPNWSACVLGGIQPEPIQRVAKDAADDGLLQRFLFAVPAFQGDGEDRVPDAAAIQRYEALFPALANLSPPRGLADLTDRKPKAVTLSRCGHIQRERINKLAKAFASMPDTSTRMQATLGKWPGTFARLTLAFHVVSVADAMIRGETPPPLPVAGDDAAERAAAFLEDIALPHLLRAEALLFQTKRTSHVRWIAGHILANEHIRAARKVSIRDLQQAYGALRAPEHRAELTAALDALEVFGWLRGEIPDNPARPRTTWLVNPALHDTFAGRATEERERRRKAQEETTALIREAVAARSANQEGQHAYG